MEGKFISELKMGPLYYAKLATLGDLRCATRGQVAQVCATKIQNIVLDNTYFFLKWKKGGNSGRGVFWGKNEGGGRG